MLPIGLKSDIHIILKEIPLRRREVGTPFVTDPCSSQDAPPGSKKGERATAA